MKKIVLLSNHAKYTYRLRKELIFELLNQGYSVDLICPYGKELDDLESEGVRLNHVPFNGRGKNPIKEGRLFLRLIYMFYKIKPDIILGYTIKFNIYGNLAARILGIPFIANITGLGEGFSKSKSLEKMLLALYRLSFKKVSHIFFQNESNKKYFEEHQIFTSSSSVLPGSGINFEEFPLTPLKKSETTTILFFSRVMKDKGIDEFLEIAKKITASNQDASFHIAGILDEEYKWIIDFYERAGVVKYHGEIEDVVSFLQQMDIVVSPSYHEGMSNTLLEAAAIGRPIIASNIAGCKEIVLEGVSGRIVPVKKADFFAEAVEELLRLDRSSLEKMGYSGRKYVEKNFDRKTVVKEYLAVINYNLSSQKDYKEDADERINSRA